MEIILFVYILSGIVTSIGCYEHHQDVGVGKLALEEYIAYSIVILVPILNTIGAFLYLASRTGERGG